MFVAFVGLIGVVTAGTVGSVYRQVEIQASRTDIRPADVIVVLGAAVWPGGRPSPTLRVRTECGIRLYKSGLAPHLLLSGGLGQNPPAEATVMAQLARRAGIPDSALVVDDRATSTWESLHTTRLIMARNGWRSALVVSDPFHMLRALTMARDLGLDAHAAPAADSPTSTVARLRRFYTLRESLALLWYYAFQRWHI